jgi:peptidoglycan LD-endopeptidase LytH
LLWTEPCPPWLDTLTLSSRVESQSGGAWYRLRMQMPQRTKRILLVIAAVIGLPLLLPDRLVIPVRGASTGDWNPKSFWYEPWGKSGVHKGIDIFAPKGQPALSPATGLVIYGGRLGIGGNVVAVLGPRWRIHYMAHLQVAAARPLTFVGKGQPVGKVGDSGNAAGKPPHLHYAILSLLPRPWRWSSQTQGWKRMFFVDPGFALSTAR